MAGRADRHAQATGQRRGDLARGCVDVPDVVGMALEARARGVPGAACVIPDHGLALHHVETYVATPPRDDQVMSGERGRDTHTHRERERGQCKVWVMISM